MLNSAFPLLQSSPTAKIFRMLQNPGPVPSTPPTRLLQPSSAELQQFRQSKTLFGSLWAVNYIIIQTLPTPHGNSLCAMVATFCCIVFSIFEITRDVKINWLICNFMKKIVSVSARALTVTEYTLSSLIHGPRRAWYFKSCHALPRGQLLVRR